MKPELKILLGATISDTKILVDDQPVGLIQSITVRASLNSAQPDVEVVFPDLFDPSLAHAQNQQARDSLQRSLSMLSPFSYVKVRLEKLVFNDD